jgi:hypothetical protein
MHAVQTPKDTMLLVGFVAEAGYDAATFGQMQ